MRRRETCISDRAVLRQYNALPLDHSLQAPIERAPMAGSAAEGALPTG